MAKLLLTGLVALAIAGPASASSVVPIVMHDPGCHFFKVNGKLSVRYVGSGAVTIRNFDEAALKFVGPGGTRIEKVGASLTLKTKGVYHITMVGQESDDNHLTLVVK